MEGLSPSESWLVFRGVLPSPVTANAVEDFARKFGELSRRDSGVGAWLVKPRKAAGTYSEIKGPAGFHTDSQYHHQPERLLYWPATLRRRRVVKTCCLASTMRGKLLKTASVMTL